MLVLADHQANVKRTAHTIAYTECTVYASQSAERIVSPKNS
jgi:hypothetical protein